MTMLALPLRRRLDRRWFLVASGAALAAPALARPAFAQATETFRFDQGGVEVIVLSDGHLVLPTAVIAPGAPQGELEPLLIERFGAVEETFETPLNITLLRSGDELILVDNGSGDRFQPSAGRLIANLDANGIAPGDVTRLVFTHAHPDHIWGTLADDGSLAFPNAAYYVGAEEWDFWTDPDLPASMPEELRPFALGAQRDLAAVAERITRLADGDSITPGISALMSPGHTPGHMSLVVESGEGLIVGGDALASEVFSVRHPEWHFGFDSDPDQAVVTRRALLDRAATDGHRYLGFHFTYPGVGNIERTGDSYRFLPIG